MAKKKQQDTRYDQGSLNAMTQRLKQMRTPIQGGGIPKLEIDLERFEKTVKRLPVKEREKLEKFWGLIPGTIRRYRSSTQKICKDISLRNMEVESNEILQKLSAIEYLYEFDKNAKDLVMKFMTKVDKTGFETLPDIEAIKYLIIFFIFLSCGHRMVYDGAITEEDYLAEKDTNYDTYGLLHVMWNHACDEISDNSINLRLLINVLEMFDLKDIAVMRKYVGLPLPKGYTTEEVETVESFWEIRKFKERIFQYGPWDNAMGLIYNHDTNEIDLTEFIKEVNKLRADWKTISKFEEGNGIIITSEGSKKVKVYVIGGLKFSDIYEVMTLYVCRNCL